MAEVILENISKKFGSLEVVSRFSDKIRDGEFVSLLGPSGCGKTTTLRIVAGFEKATTGKVYIGNQLVSCSETHYYLPPEKRNIGMVFQSYAVWPHMTVFDNVAYPLKVRGTPKPITQEKVERVLDLVHMTGLEKRLPSQLSGGQQQRVALARALVAEPSLLLLDEPLSNLDAKLRESMRFEIKDVQRRLQITVIYVTHDQAEAMVMSDRIIVMEKGLVQQADIPRRIYEAPANRFVADFIGLINFLEAKVISRQGNDGVIELAEIPGSVRLSCSLGQDVKSGGRVTAAVRPEHIGISSAPVAGWIKGKVARKAYLGDEVDYRVAIGPVEIRVTANTTGEDIPEGRDVWIEFKKILAMTL
jgi:iron(III) transport system ATP-binding protein